MCRLPLWLPLRSPCRRYGILANDDGGWWLVAECGILATVDGRLVVGEMQRG